MFTKFIFGFLHVTASTSFLNPLSLLVLALQKYGLDSSFSIFSPFSIYCAKSPLSFDKDTFTFSVDNVINLSSSFILTLLVFSSLSIFNVFGFNTT